MYSYAEIYFYLCFTYLVVCKYLITRLSYYNVTTRLVGLFWIFFDSKYD